MSFRGKKSYTHGFPFRNVNETHWIVLYFLEAFFNHMPCFCPSIQRAIFFSLIEWKINSFLKYFYFDFGARKFSVWSALRTQLVISRWELKISEVMFQTMQLFTRSLNRILFINDRLGVSGFSFYFNFTSVGCWVFCCRL